MLHGSSCHIRDSTLKVIPQLTFFGAALPSSRSTSPRRWLSFLRWLIFSRSAADDIVFSAVISSMVRFSPSRVSCTSAHATADEHQFPCRHRRQGDFFETRRTLSLVLMVDVDLTWYIQIRRPRLDMQRQILNRSLTAQNWKSLVSTRFAFSDLYFRFSERWSVNVTRSW